MIKGIVGALILAVGSVAIAEEVVYFEQEDKRAVGYLALPNQFAESEGAPAIVLIHEWWGLNDDIRAKADAFADEGYVALAVDLYYGESTDKVPKAIQLAGSVRRDREGAFENLRAAFDYLRAFRQVDEKRLASVGWCFGGGWSYQIAKNDLGAAVSIIYYGRFNPSDDLSQMRATILGHFAEQDAGIKLDDVKQFAMVLEQLGGDHAIYIYENSSHGFANPDSSVYNRQSAESAWQRTLFFLEQHL